MPGEMRRADSLEMNSIPPQSPTSHCTGVGPCQPDVTHHVALEEALPLVVDDVEEVCEVEDAQVVDRDDHRRTPGDDRFGSSNATQIGNHAADRSPGTWFLNFAIAASTRWDNRPLTGTAAPAPNSPLAIA